MASARADSEPIRDFEGVQTDLKGLWILKKSKEEDPDAVFLVLRFLRRLRE